MDPLTAIGLAGTVIQIVDFTGKLISKGNELYQSASGLLAEHVDLELAASDLRHLTEELKSRSSVARCATAATKDDLALQDLSERCAVISDELIAALTELNRAGPTRRRWRSYRQALKTLWHREKLEDISQRLLIVRDQLEFRIIVHLRERINDISTLQLRQLAATNNSTNLIIQALKEDQNVFDRFSKNQINLLNVLHQKSDVIIDEQKQTRFEILNALDQQSRHILALGNLSAAVPSNLDNGSKEGDLLEMLYFHTIDDRYEDIAEAHRQTYEWALIPSTEAKHPEGQKSNFCDWLTSGQGIYWIAGKAGSGKSTLMKFIYNDPRTSKILKVWAKNGSIVIAGFFFWNSGSQMQKSQLGLLQSIIHEIIKKYPEMQDILFPEAIRRAATMRWRTRSGTESIWSLNELKRVFKTLLQQTDLNICLFIDGLDEYEGNHADIVDLIQGASLSSTVKICLSSRPLIIFETAFESSSSLRLQEITHNDISMYVRDKLESHPIFQRLLQEEPDESIALLKAIVEKAFGVFLWIKFVVRSLIEGLSGSDRASDLFTRLEEIPKDLLDLYAYMLKSIKPHFYLAQASKILLIVETAAKVSKGPLDLIELCFAESYANQKKNFLHESTNHMSDSTIDSMTQEVSMRLQSRCLGFLEPTDQEFPDTGFGMNMAKRCKRGKKSTVRFMHHTVRDFLATPSTQQILWGAVGSSFNPYSCLMASAIACLKYRNPGFEPYSEGDDCTKNFSYATEFEMQAIRVQFTLNCARMVEATTGQPETELLDLLETVARDVTLDPASAWFMTGSDVEKAWRRQKDNEGVHWAFLKHFGKSMPPVHEDTFLSMCTDAGLELYVEEKFDNPVQALGRPLLHQALIYDLSTTEPLKVGNQDGLLRREVLDDFTGHSWSADAGLGEASHVSMVEMLLMAKADPNESYRSRTVWQDFLHVMIHMLQGPDFFGRDIRSSSSVKKAIAVVALPHLLLLLNAGADLRASITCPTLFSGHQKKYSSVAWAAIQDLLNSCSMSDPQSAQKIENFITDWTKSSLTNEECLHSLEDNQDPGLDQKYANGFVCDVALFLVRGLPFHRAHELERFQKTLSTVIQNESEGLIPVSSEFGLLSSEVAGSQMDILPRQSTEDIMSAPSQSQPFMIDEGNSLAPPEQDRVGKSSSDSERPPGVIALLGTSSNIERTDPVTKGFIDMLSNRTSELTGKLRRYLKDKPLNIPLVRVSSHEDRTARPPESSSVLRDVFNPRSNASGSHETSQTYDAAEWQELCIRLEGRFRHLERIHGLANNDKYWEIKYELQYQLLEQLERMAKNSQFGPPAKTVISDLTDWHDPRLHGLAELE